MFDIRPLLFSPILELWVLAAHLILPASAIDGYVRDSNDKPLKYRLSVLPGQNRRRASQLMILTLYLVMASQFS